MSLFDNVSSTVNCIGLG